MNRWRNFDYRGYCGLLFVTLAVSAGCGESKRDVIGRYQRPCAELRVKLKEYAAALPPVGSVRETKIARGLNPAPVYDAPGKRGNTEIVMDVQLTDPDAVPELDLNLSRDLLRCLAWAGPKSPLVESAQDSAAGAIEQEFKQALEWKYLAVVRVVQFDRPEVVAEGQFRGGDLVLEVFLIRAADGQVVAAFPVRAKAADSVNVSAKTTESMADRARAFVHSSAWQDARSKVADGLRQASGGEFKVD